MLEEALDGLLGGSADTWEQGTEALKQVTLESNPSDTENNSREYSIQHLTDIFTIKMGLLVS